MTKLPHLLLFALFSLLCAAGCRDREAPKAKPTQAPTQETVPAGDPTWAERLPSVASAVKVSLETTAGIVELTADGKVRVAATPTTAELGDPLAKARFSARDAVVTELGLPVRPKREAPALEGTGVQAEQGSAAGSAASNPFDELSARLGHPMPASSAPTAAPARQTTAFALAHPHDVSAGVIVLADPKAPASALVEILAQTGGFIAVRTSTGVGALPFAFDRQEPARVAPYTPWLELYPDEPRVLVNVLGNAPPPADRLDDALKASNAKALDVLVSPTTTVGDLVKQLDVVRAAGVEAIGLGRALDLASPATTERIAAGPRVLAWDFFMVGMDKTSPVPFRAAFDATLPRILDCYKRALDKAPSAASHGRVELTVVPDGRVGDVIANTGIGKELTICVTREIKKAAFPKIAVPTKITAQLAFVNAAAGESSPSTNAAGSAGSAAPAGSDSAR